MLSLWSMVSSGSAEALCSCAGRTHLTCCMRSEVQRSPTVFCSRQLSVVGHKMLSRLHSKLLRMRSWPQALALSEEQQPRSTQHFRALFGLFCCSSGRRIPRMPPSGPATRFGQA